MKIDPYWHTIFIVSGILVLVLSILTKVILQNHGFKVSWRANLNQWGQLYQLIKSEQKRVDKWKYAFLLITLILSVIITIVAFIKS